MRKMKSLRTIAACFCALTVTAGGARAGSSVAERIPLSGSGSRTITRVRSADPVIAALVREAGERSPTFHMLVAAIGATDGLVYVNAGTCGRLRACLLHRVTLAGPSRVLNIVVDVRRHDIALAAAIGHELQHSLEVLRDARIRNDVDIFAFYTMHRLELNGVIETRAAIAAGEAVRDEVHRSTTAAPVF